MFSSILCTHLRANSFMLTLVDSSKTSSLYVQCLHPPLHFARSLLPLQHWDKSRLNEQFVLKSKQKSKQLVYSAGYPRGTKTRLAFGYLSRAHLDSRNTVEARTWSVSVVKSCRMRINKQMKHADDIYLHRSRANNWVISSLDHMTRRRQISK